MLRARHTATESTSWACFPGADTLQIPIDPNGNLTTKTEGTDTWAYEWNARNELTRVTKNTIEQARFSYDPLGRRVEKVAGGVTTSYTYDGGDILREVRGASTFRYIHGPGVDEPLAGEDGAGALTYNHVDGLGSILKRTNSAGAIVHEYRYDAWGSIETGTSEPGQSFTGREWDPEISLYAYRARYYDPKIGRFISEDPIQHGAGAPNFYPYVEDNPVSWVDPLGLAPGDRYKRRNQAAKQAMRDIYWRTRRQGMEYCGNICRMGDGNGFTYDSPEKGTSGGCEAKPMCPDQSQPVGYYHSHPDTGHAADNYFSGDDKNNTLGPPLGTGQPGYMIDPQGNMKKWHRGKQWDLGCIFP